MEEEEVVQPMRGAGLEEDGKRESARERERRHFTLQ
jgi:hypothetical protein